MSPGPFRWRGWLNFHWMNECLNAHGFMDRVQSVTSFIALSVQTRVRSSTVDFNHASCLLSSSVHGGWLSRICRLLSQIWTLTTLTSCTVWMHADIKLLLQTDTPRHRQELRPAQVGTEYTVNYNLYTRESSWHPNSNTLEPDRPQHDSPATCVIAQQYSPANLVSLRLHFLQGKVWPAFQKCYFFLIS